MSTTTSTAHAPPLRPARTALRTVALVAVIAAATNLLLWAGANAGGVDFTVAQPGGRSMTVGPAVILVTTIAPLVAGWLALVVVGGRLRNARRRLAWTGLALGVLTMPMPFTVEATTSTQISLMLMHLSTGLVWWLLLRRAADR